jgi:hypothetical protein
MNPFVTRLKFMMALNTKYYLSIDIESTGDRYINTVK